MTQPTPTKVLPPLEKMLEHSAPWIARAIYRLGKNCEELLAFIKLLPPGSVPSLDDDVKFFVALVDHFEKEGFFTDRQISLGKMKFRPAYISWLHSISER